MEDMVIDLVDLEDTVMGMVVLEVTVMDILVMEDMATSLKDLPVIASTKSRLDKKNRTDTRNHMVMDTLTLLNIFVMVILHTP